MTAAPRNLAELAEAGLRYSTPQSLEEAEAMLRLLAGALAEPAAARSNLTDRAVPTTPPPPAREHAAEIQQSIVAVARFSVAYDAVPDALLIVNSDGIITLVNSQLEQMFGYNREELLQQAIEILVPERFRAMHPQHRRAYFAELHVRPMGAGLSLHGRHRDGHEFPVEISLSPLEVETGLMVVATIRDLTKQRKVEAQLRRFEARYRTLVEGLPAVTFMAALDEGVNELYVSPQIETLLGFSQEEWLGNPILWYTQLHPDDRKRWHSEFAVTCLTGRIFSSIYRFYSRSGQVVWVHGEAKVIRDDQGRPLYLQGVAFDITQMKEAEAQLRQLNQTLESRVNERTAELSASNDSLQLEIRERKRVEDEIRRINEDLASAHEAAITANQTKSQFLANMSHELRTPLNAIIGYSELLQLLAVRKKDTTFTPDLERINKSGKHLLSLINDILDISKIEAGKMVLDLLVFNVRLVVDEVQETVQPLAAANGNTLEVHCAPQLDTIRADAVRLKQCLLNLLSNACKFTERGKIALKVDQQLLDGREWLVFEVKDTGIGLTSEQAARLFQPFTQADASTTRKFGGTGLGLAITKKFCEAMGGSIRLESTFGHGSTFTIQLPVCQEP